jgi:hypothetical protein
LTPRGLVTRALAGALAGTALALFLMSALVALGGLREDGGFDVLGPLVDMLTPSDVRAWLELFGALVFGTLCGLFTAAVFAARSGATDEAGETA